MTPVLAVAVIAAGGLGALLRSATSRLGASARWPWPVLVVNVVGSLIAGVAVHTDAALVVVTGFCGGLTTFSTLSVETIQLWLDGRRRAAAASIALNLTVGLAAATAGWTLGLALL